MGAESWKRTLERKSHALKYSAFISILALNERNFQSKGEIQHLGGCAEVLIIAANYLQRVLECVCVCVLECVYCAGVCFLVCPPSISSLTNGLLPLGYFCFLHPVSSATRGHA